MYPYKDSNLDSQIKSLEHKPFYHRDICDETGIRTQNPYGAGLEDRCIIQPCPLAIKRDTVLHIY